MFLINRTKKYGIKTVSKIFGVGSGNRTRAVGSEAQHSATKLYPQ